MYLNRWNVKAKWLLPKYRLVNFAMDFYFYRQPIFLPNSLSSGCYANSRPILMFALRWKFCLILEGVDLLDHTSIFLLRTINHRVIPIIRILSKEVLSYFLLTQRVINANMMVYLTLSVMCQSGTLMLFFYPCNFNWLMPLFIHVFTFE